MTTLAAWRRRARTLKAGGRALRYWTANECDESKPWLLLIHGFPTSSWDWTALWPMLASHFRIAAMDMLGFGLSDKPAGARYSIFVQADFQEALLEHLGAGEAHILAHDYGDTVAQELIARHNEGTISFSVKSAVFLNGGLFPEQHRALPMQKFGLTPLGFLLGFMMTKPGLKQAFDRIFGPETKLADEEMDAHWTLIEENRGRRVLHRLLRYIPERRANRARWVGALSETAVPMRLINGGADPVSGAHMYRRYKELVPNADAVLLEKIGHYPQIEAPAAAARAFLAFHERLGSLRSCPLS